jgi:hypothetical protein
MWLRKKKLKANTTFSIQKNFEEQKDKKQLKQKYGCLLSIVSRFFGCELVPI